MGILAHTSRHQSALAPNRGLEALGPLGRANGFCCNWDRVFRHAKRVG